MTTLILPKIVQYEPIGVCAGIGAWNGSAVFFGFKVAAALATGCTFIYKGSEKSPLGVLQLGELVKEAGFPPGTCRMRHLAKAKIDKPSL